MEILELKNEAVVEKPDEETLVGSKFRRAVENTNGAIDWYSDAGKAKGQKCKILLGASIFLFGAGGLCPIFKATGLLDSIEWSSFGYVFIGLAGIFLLFDKFYGLSTGWTRYTLTELKLRESLNDFHDEWGIETVGVNCSDLNNEKTVELLEKINIYNDLIFDIVREETEAWATEFRSNVSELNRLIREEMEKRRASVAEQKKAQAQKKRQEQERAKTGYVKVQIKGSETFDKIAVRLGENEKVLSAHECVVLFSEIPPGVHELSVVGETSGGKKTVADFVEVEGGQIIDKEMDLS